MENGFYWYIGHPDDEFEHTKPEVPCEVEVGGVYDVYFTGSEVGESFADLHGTFEPLIYKNLVDNAEMIT